MGAPPQRYVAIAAGATSLPPVALVSFDASFDART